MKALKKKKDPTIAELLRHDTESHRLIMLLSGSHAARSERIIRRLTKDNLALQTRLLNAISLLESLRAECLQKSKKRKAPK